MSAQENKAIVRRFWEESAKEKDLSILQELLAEDFVNHNPVPGFANDKQGFKKLISTYYEALPDHTVTIKDLIAQGDLVATRWTVRGTHEGEMMGIPPTGKQVEITGITIDRVVDGQIVAQWQQADMLGLMQQLGAVPAPEAAG